MDAAALQFVAQRKIGSIKRLEMVWNQSQWFTNSKSNVGHDLPILQLNFVDGGLCSNNAHAHEKIVIVCKSIRRLDVPMSHQEKRKKTLIAYFHPLLLLSILFIPFILHQRHGISKSYWVNGSHTHTLGVGVSVLSLYSIIAFPLCVPVGGIFGIFRTCFRDRKVG